MLEKGLIGFLEENKKKLIFGAFVIIIIIVVVFLLDYLKEKKEATEETLNLSTTRYPIVYPDDSEIHYPLTEERCENIKDQAQKRKCFNDLEYAKAVVSKEINRCLFLADEKKIDDCIFYIVKLKSHEGTARLEDCEKIKDKEKRSRCIIENLAVNTFNYDICDKYFVNEPFKRKECKDKTRTFDIVVNKKDISLCREVKTLEYTALCYGYMFAKGQDCSMLPDGPDKDYCEDMYYFADVKTINDCNKLSLDDYKKVCMRVIKEKKPASDLDSDRDGISDGEELSFKISPFNPDTDGDGINDYHEVKVLGTDPLNQDTDGDGIKDLEEIKLGTDPNVINR